MTNPLGMESFEGYNLRGTWSELRVVPEDSGVRPIFLKGLTWGKRPKAILTNVRITFSEATVNG